MTRPEPQLVVEFVGPPGAGKSTAAALLTRSLESRGWSCGSREELTDLRSPRLLRYGRLAGFYLRRPSEFRAAVRLGSAASSPTPLQRAQGLKYVSLWSFRFTRARDQGWDVLILDQGIVQSAWSLLLRGSWRDDMVQSAVSRAILATGFRYVLVYLDLAVDLAAKRIAQRPTMASRFDHLDPTETARQLSVEGQRLEQLFGGVAQATGAANCRVDAAKSPAEISSHIEHFIEGWLPSTPRAAVRAS